jgi:ABC-2 type transport system permease protein
MTVLLWLVLVGSLGMLLQAVVRERANRALESLLSAARASEVLLGKLLGVGALSVLVVAVWLAGGAALALSPGAPSTGAAGALLSQLGDIRALGVSAALFILTFGMYGAALIALGALARDMPAAQNLSRPVFMLLLLIFFVAVGQVTGLGESSLGWLVFLPPFTPFVLMLAKPGAIDLWRSVVGVVGMLGLTAVCLWLGALALRGELRVRWFGAAARISARA